MKPDNWNVSAADMIAMNTWHRDLRDLAIELHDVGLDDPEEALLKLDGIVGIANEWRALVQRRADEQASHPREDVPAADMSWVK